MTPIKLQNSRNTRKVTDWLDRMTDTPLGKAILAWLKKNIDGGDPQPRIGQPRGESMGEPMGENPFPQPVEKDWEYWVDLFNHLSNVNCQSFPAGCPAKSEAN